MKTLTVLSTKYDGSLHRRYEATLLAESEWGWLTFLPRDQRVVAHNGTWLNPHPHLRWHWRDRWWDALLVFDDEDRGLEWYCNLITPPRLTQGTLRFHDLDLDVVWHRERGLRIVDVNEFEENTRRLHYPRTLVQHIWDVAYQVRRQIERGGWPFDDDPQHYHLEQELAAWINGHST